MAGLPLTDADVDALTTPAAAPSTPQTGAGLTDAQVDAAATAHAPGLLESFLRGTSEGGTFGADTKFGLTDKARNEAARAANPWTHFAGEMIGGAAPMVAASLLPTGATQAAAAGRLAQLGTRAAGLVRGALAPGEISTLGQSLRQGAKLGAVYGGLSGAGHAESGDEASGALRGATVGAALGLPLGAAGYGVSRLAEGIAGARAAARAETEDASRGAIHALARAMQRDRISPDDLITQIRAEFPTDTATAGGLGFRRWGGNPLPGGGVAPRQPWTPDMVDEVVRRALAGESAADISTAMRAAGNGVGPGDTSVTTLLTELANRYSVPMNIVDRTKMVRAGSGENVGWLTRAAAATPGEARAFARESLVERQLGQGSRLTEAITQHIGTPDFDGELANLTRRIAATNDTLYNAARVADEKVLNATGRSIGDDIQPVLDAHAVKWQYSRGPVADAIKSAVDSFRPSSTGTQLQPLTSLDAFLQAKQNLQALIDGNLQNKTVLRALQQFKGDLYDAVETRNPAWKIANDTAADGFAADRALRLGNEYATRLGPQSREQLAKFRAMSDDEKNLFRIGVAQKLNDLITMNRQGTHDLTAELRLPATRKTLREILGPKQADAFFSKVDREFATTRTYREQFGSQTTPLREAIDELNWAPRFEASWHNLGLGSVARLATEYAARTINANRNERLMRLLTNTDPLQQLDILRGVGLAHTARNNAQRYIGAPAVGSAAPAGQLFTGRLADDERRQRAVLDAYRYPPVRP